MAEKHEQSDFDEDETEEGTEVVGNVHKLKVHPASAHPLNSNPARKGELIFDACFESGNLGRVDYISEYEYDLFIRPDTCNARFRVWFNFTVENTRADQRVIFNVVNFSKTKSLFREGMTPLVKSSSRPNWVRIPEKQVFYYRCPDHRKFYVLTFAFCFDRDDDVYQFCYSFTYSYTRLQNYLLSIERKNYSFVERELLTLTVQQRRLDLLTITSDPREDNKSKRMVFITARVHPGETPASFVCQGLVDYLLSAQPAARLLRDHVIFKIVPMLNPDGVYLGNYRCSLMGFDLNRYWLEPSPWAHPTLYATKQMLAELDSCSQAPLDLYLDIHSHSTLTSAFIYGNIYEDPLRHERQLIFPRLLASNAIDFSLVNTNFNKDAIKAGTGRRTLGTHLSANVNCYTLEVSYHGFHCHTGSQTSNNIVPYTEDSYMKLGRNVGKTFVDYYKQMGVLKTATSSKSNTPDGSGSSSSSSRSKWNGHCR